MYKAHVRRILVLIIQTYVVIVTPAHTHQKMSSVTPVAASDTTADRKEVNWPTLMSHPPSTPLVGMKPTDHWMLFIISYVDTTLQYRGLGAAAQGDFQ